MQPSNLSSITVADLLAIPSRELQTFQVTLTEAIEQRKEQDKSELIEKINSLTTESGFSLNDLVGNGTPSKKSRSANKYRNPQNVKQMWAGRGRKPNWLLELLAAGRSVEEFRI